MKFRDRSEILAQLQDAFVQEEKKESRVTTEVLRIDNHNVARVTQIRDPSLEEKLYAKYPEAVTIREMITILGSSDDSDIKQAGLRLQKKTLDAFDDALYIGRMSVLCRDFESRYYGSVDNIRKQMVLYYFTSEMEKI